MAVRFTRGEMMKTLLKFIIAFTLIYSFSCKKDTSPLNTILSEISSGDDSGISDSIRSSYRSDAAYLAYRHIYLNMMADTALIHIPQPLIDSFYEGLIHIYNCKSITSIDTITKIYAVHAFPEISLYRLVVGFDTSYAWTKQWQEGFTITGNDSIDSLITHYEFELYRKARYRFGVLVTKIPLNMWVLGQVFNQIAGVRFAEPDGAVGSGNDIIATLNMDHTHYKFTIGWGDCLAGCTQRRYWEYTVSSAGEVKYLGSYGDSFYLN
jgi:hypothetical protein